jgi:N-methylhydantoinase A
MANAIRAKTVQKGLDPRGFSMVAFGGAGPLHGAEVAAMLNIPELVVPPHPGITSAAGLLTTDLKYDQIKTEFQVKGSVDLARLSEDFAGLSKGLLEQFAADGLSADQVAQRRFGDLRYVGQGYELRVAESPIEIVNIRLTGVGTMPKIADTVAAAGGSLGTARVKSAPSVFRVNGVLESFETDFYVRETLPLGEPIKGPAIILQKDATTVIPPGWQTVVDESANLILKAEAKG